MHVFSKVTIRWVKLRITAFVLLGCVLLLASGAQAFPVLTGDVALGKTAKADQTWSVWVDSYATDGTTNFWNAWRLVSPLARDRSWTGVFVITS